MDKTENLTKPEEDEKEKKRFPYLVLMASILSIGSLIWSTYSFLDLYKVDALTVERLGGLSLISLSVAAMMDVVWSGTMVAQYQGQRYVRKPFWRKKSQERDFLPLIGWIEALFVAGLLGYHGSTIAGGSAAFAAILPLVTKFTWTLALDGMKDPTELTEEEKAEIAADQREVNRTRAKLKVASDKHRAEAIQKDQEHQAALADQRRQNEMALEKAEAKAAEERIRMQADFEAEKTKAENEAELKRMRNDLSARIQIESMENQNRVELTRMEAEQNMRMNAPLGYNLIQGQVMNRHRPQLPQQGGEEGPDGKLELHPVLAAMSPAERAKVELAARYFTVDHREGGVKKTDFCKANDGLHLPRVSEATTKYDAKWFIDNDLALWMD